MKRKFFVKNLLILIIPLLIPIVLIGGFAINLAHNYIMEDIDKGNIKVLNQTKEAVELLFNDLDSFSLNFNLNPLFLSKFKTILQNKEIGLASPENYEVYNYAMNLINPSANSKPYIQSIYVYFKNPEGNFFISNSGLENVNTFIDKSWYSSFITSNDAVNTWIETRDIKQYEFEKDDTRLVTIYKKLYSPGLGRADGVIVMNIKRDYIDALLEGLLSYPEQAAVILDENDNVVAASNNKTDINERDVITINSNSSGFFEYKAKGKSYMVSQVKSNRYNLKYISIIPKGVLYKLPLQLLYITLYLLVISFILGLVLTFFLTKRKYNNLLNIISTFESAENGKPLPPLPSRINDEYSYILQNVIKTFIEQSYLKVQLSEKKYHLKTMEFIALQSQINPHFLLNTLKTIFWKSINLTGDQNEVSKMIEHLSGILSYSLNSSDKTVTLEEEINNTLSYIEIQKVRYKDKFRVIWQYDDAIVHHKVLKFLFQPLIENSIYHGIKEKDGFSYIKIKIFLKDSLLKIAIIDNGLGIESDLLHHIRDRLNQEGEVSKHIGLYNTNKRLRLTYGDENCLLIRSKRGLGTVIHINIPVT